MDMQADVEGGGDDETFWTACSVCKLLHQFERKYLGFSLMCPSCNKSFKAVEFVEGVETDVVDEDEDSDDMVLNDYKSKRKTSSVSDIMKDVDDEDSDDMVLKDFNSKRKTSSVGDIMKRSERLSNSVGSGNGGVRRVSKRTRVARRKDDEEVM
ncbi:DnaJ domain-containing protein, partial [Tanacetum coccineum]